MREKIYEDLSIVRRRARFTLISVQILLAVIILIFWRIQVLNHRKYWELSEANRMNEIRLRPQRGLILDRNGKIFTRNVASFTAALIKEKSQDLESSYQGISKLLNLDPEVIKARIQKYSLVADFQPIVIKEDLIMEEVAMIRSRNIEFPELLIQAEPKRNYPHSSLAAHVLGYLQEISPEELSSGDFPSGRVGDLIGKTGIEKQYETQLTGVPGTRLEIVDSTGRSIDVLSQRDPVKGRDVYLTLDLDIQQKAEELLAEREGSVIVMDVKNGEILALASYPTYDPNKFINRFTPEEWIELINRGDHPLENRAIRGLYSPGSLFKPVMGLAALDSGVVNEYTRFTCTGSIEIYNHPFACSFAAGHGSLDLRQALRHSCNIYFYQIGNIMGIEEIARYARILGMGKLTGIDLLGEKAGLVPDQAWKMRVRQQPWYPGETISVSIGQGPLMVTPIQIAYLTAIIANRGSAVKPHLVSKGLRLESNQHINIKGSDFDLIIQGMWLAVNEEGTARRAFVQGFDVCGKTGSTQVIGRETAERLLKQGRQVKTHSWFTGFAPRPRPEIAITVIVERSGAGGLAATQLAGELFRTYRESHD